MRSTSTRFWTGARPFALYAKREYIGNERVKTAVATYKSLGGQLLPDRSLHLESIVHRLCPWLWTKSHTFDKPDLASA